VSLWGRHASLFVSQSSFPNWLVVSLVSSALWQHVSSSHKSFIAEATLEGCWKSCVLPLVPAWFVTRGNLHNGRRFNTLFMFNSYGDLLPLYGEKCAAVEDNINWRVDGQNVRCSRQYTMCSMGGADKLSCIRMRCCFTPQRK